MSASGTKRTSADIVCCSSEAGFSPYQSIGVLKRRGAHRHKDAARVGALVADPPAGRRVIIAGTAIELTIRRPVGTLKHLASGDHLPLSLGSDRSSLSLTSQQQSLVTQQLEAIQVRSQGLEW